MGKIICKLPNGNFLEWSTVVDAPVSPAMPREQFDQYVKVMYGQNYYENEHFDRMKFVLKHGTSSRVPAPTSFEELIEGNRAGPDENSLTLDEIVAAYGQFDPDDQLPNDMQPDGYQIIDVTTGECVNHDDHVILTWALACEKAPSDDSGQYVIVGVMAHKVAANTESGLAPCFIAHDI